MSRLPRFQLFVEADYENDSAAGWWRFSLEGIDTESLLDAEDYEQDLTQHRLELIGLMRALEALEQPSQVQLVTESRYLSRGLRVGLPLWRENEWRWERFGEMAPIKDCDLWQRVDHALSYHRLQTRLLRIDGAHGRVPVAAGRAAWSAQKTTIVTSGSDFASDNSVAPVAPTAPKRERSRVILTLADNDEANEPAPVPATRVYRRSGRRNRLGIA